MSSLDYAKLDCYVYNLLTKTKIEFTTTPESVSDSGVANFEAVDIKGRSGPYQGYNNSGPRQVSVGFKLHQDLLGQSVSIVTVSNQLRALTYPLYQGGQVSTPKAFLRIGDNIGIKCIIPNVSVNWLHPVRDGKFIHCDVQLEAIECIPDPAWDAQGVERGSDFSYGG